MRRWLAGAVAALGISGAAQAAVSDDFSQNQAAAIAAYSTWRTAPVWFYQAGLSFQNGVFVVSWTETPAGVVADQNARNARMNGGQFSWNDWLAASRAGTGQSTYNVTCVFPANAGQRIASFPEGGTTNVRMKLRSASGLSLVFDCEF